MAIDFVGEINQQTFNNLSPPFVMHLMTESIFSALCKWFNFDIIEK